MKQETLSHHTPTLKDVTLLVTHFNRSSSLQRLLETLHELGLCFGNIIISDDGSDIIHINKLDELKNKYHFQLVTSDRNKGLGHNINKGQDAVKTPFTLYIQEDFVPTTNFIQAFQDAVSFMREDKEMDLIRFFSNFKYPYLAPFKKGFAKMYIPFLALDYKKIYLYSDGPHLRRSNFLQKFGRYKEGLHGDRTEYWMCISFIRKKGKALFYLEYKSLFDHINTEDEPSKMERPKWNQTPGLVLLLTQYVYRQLRYNYDIFFQLKNRML